MRLQVMVWLALVTGVFGYRARGVEPQTRPARELAFAIVQEGQIEGREKVTTSIHVVGDYVVLLTAGGEVAGFYDLGAKAFYAEGHEQLVKETVIEGWLKGWRSGTSFVLGARDPKAAAYRRSLLWPELKVTEEEGRLLIRTEAAHMDVVPMKGVDAATAEAYAAWYRMDAYRTAWESRNGSTAFLAAAIAGVLREQGVLPEAIEITTFTPNGSAKVVMSARREDLNDDQIAWVRKVAEQFGATPKAGAGAAPATAPAATAPGVTEEAESVAAADASLRELERLLQAKDGAGVRRLVLVTRVPNAQEQADAFVHAVNVGTLAQARVLPLASRKEGPVIGVMTALMRHAEEPAPEVELTLFVRRDGQWRPIFDTPNNARTIMDDQERKSAEALVQWSERWEAPDAAAIRARARGEVK